MARRARGRVRLPRLQEGRGDDGSASRWCDNAGWQTVLNRAGTTFRKLDDADKRALTQDKAVALMVGQPSMIKRPVLDADGKLEIGFRPERYAALFGG